MTEPHMSHGWLHALVRRADDPAGPGPYGTVVDDLGPDGARVKVRWPDGTRSWEAKRDLWPWTGDQPD